ncbi:MAG TPA: hypothetical protein VMV46_23445 [Thermoanaerobaculia bacterium]|nr:hypothetical protein [Thermoanaerobaculia bacterium]
MAVAPRGGPGDPRPARWAGWPAAVVALLVVGCSSSLPRTTPAPPPAASDVGEGALDAGLFTLPAAELGTQRIVRLRYQGPGDDGTLYLVLRLERPDRYTLEGNARLLGKSVFRLMVDDGRAIFLDLQRSEYCRLERAIEISAIPLGPLPFDVLPALLLGRLPTAPASPVQRSGEAGDLAFRDGQGREWTVQVRDGRVERWTLWREGEPAVWWLDDGSAAYLSAREEGLQLRWRAGAAEPLRAPLEPPAVPTGFTAGSDCG